MLNNNKIDIDIISEMGYIMYRDRGGAYFFKTTAPKWGKRGQGGNKMSYGDYMYDSWLLSAADESAAERYLPDDYEPETVRFVIWWYSESENCEDSIDIEVDNTPDKKKWAEDVANEMIQNGDDGIPTDAVITSIREDD